MDFLQYIDIFNFIIMLILLIIVIFKILSFKKIELLSWLPSIILLTLVLYIEVNETSILNIYLIGVVTLAYTIISSTIVSHIDRNKKFSEYYSFGTIFLGLFTIFTIHFGGVVNSVLTMPLFYILMLISLSIIIIVPIVSLVNNKLDTYYLLGVFGCVIIAFAIWLQWTMLIGEIFAKIMLLIGILCFAGNFLLTDRFGYKGKE